MATQGWWNEAKELTRHAKEITPRSGFFLDVRDKPGLFTAVARELVGDTFVSFEGDLTDTGLDLLPNSSSRETKILRRGTLVPRQDFVVLPLDAEQLDPILSCVLPEARIVHNVLHVQIEKAGGLCFGAYDQFHRDHVVASTAVPDALLDRLVEKGVLRGFERYDDRTSFPDRFGWL